MAKDNHSFYLSLTLLLSFTALDVAVLLTTLNANTAIMAPIMELSSIPNYKSGYQILTQVQMNVQGSWRLQISESQ